MTSSDPIDPLVEAYAQASRVADHQRASREPAPVVIINITGGCEQWTITAAGTGEPEVFILDFDDEADLDWREANLARFEEARRLVSGRIDRATESNMLEGIENEREGIAALKADMEEAGA